MLGRVALVSMKRRIKVQVRCATAKEAKRFAEDNLSTVVGAFAFLDDAKKAAASLNN